MDDAQWWRAISTADLLALRRRLLRHIEAEFGGRLKAELEDLVQHAFVILFRRRDSVAPENDGLYRYLKTTCRNAALDRIKGTQRRQKGAEQSAHPRGSHTPASAVPDTSPMEVAEENEKIWQVFRALSNLDRLVVWSYIVEERSIRRIAREVGLDWHRVAEIISDALSEFRERLTD